MNLMNTLRQPGPGHCCLFMTMAVQVKPYIDIGGLPCHYVAARLKGTCPDLPLG